MVVRGDVDLAVLDVLGMGQHDVVDVLACEAARRT